MAAFRAGAVRVRSCNGVIFKGVGQRDASRRRLKQSHPRLGERGHGSWYLHCSATDLFGRRERACRGGSPCEAPPVGPGTSFLAGTAAGRPKGLGALSS